MMACCSFPKYYAVEENNFLQQVITRYKILIHHFTPTSKWSTNEWKHPSKPTNTTYWQSADHHLCDLSGVLLVDFLGHICTCNTDTYRATLKSLWEVLTILAVVQCSSTTMPHCTQHSRLTLCCNIFNEKPWTIPHKLKIWYLANFSRFPPSRSNCHIILPVTKMSNMLQTSGWYNRDIHHPIHLGWATYHMLWQVP
jgi:hypothetical protein